MSFRLFGFTIITPSDQEQTQTASPITPTNTEAAGTIYDNGMGAFGTYAVDFESAATVVNELDLINQYRQLSMQPEVDEAVNDVINELIIRDDDTPPVSLFCKSMPDNYSEDLRQKLQREFEYLLDLMDFNNQCYEIARQFYVDGRLYYDLVIDNSDLSTGIKELRLIDPRTIRPMRKVHETVDANTGIRLVNVEDEYYIYNPQGFRSPSHLARTEGIPMTKDRVAYVNSGVYTPGYFAVLSHLHKAIKPFNQLRMVEDATVIYRITRAPERRVFYIDIGDIPSSKAEAYIQSVATRYRNRMAYNSTTGEVQDDRKIQSMLEDFFLPRRGGTGRGTEIQTLPGGENLGEMADVEYFKRKLYKALNIPMSRLEPNGGTYTPGRVAEITRDEIKFGRFLSRQRSRMGQLFDQMMARHLTLKGIIRNPAEWAELRKYIRYEWVKDSYFSEIKELEILTGRLNTLTAIEPFVGRYFSEQYVRDRVLRQTPDEQEQINNDKADNPDANIDHMALGRELEYRERETGIDAMQAQIDATEKQTKLLRREPTAEDFVGTGQLLLLEDTDYDTSVAEILAENAK